MDTIDDLKKEIAETFAGVDRIIAALCALEDVSASDYRDDDYDGDYDKPYSVQVINGLKVVVNKCLDLVDECKAAGTYDAAMYKSDKAEMGRTKKLINNMRKEHSELYKELSALKSKYVDMCSAYSGMPVMWNPRSVRNVPVEIFTDSDACATRAVEVAEEKLAKEWKGEDV